MSNEKPTVSQSQKVNAEMLPNGNLKYQDKEFRPAGVRQSVESEITKMGIKTGQKVWRKGKSEIVEFVVGKIGPKYCFIEGWQKGTNNPNYARFDEVLTQKPEMPVTAPATEQKATKAA